MNITTDNEITTILSALQFLAARCDGAQEQDSVGFNKPDSWIGKKLASQQTLSETDTDQALDLLTKYKHSQLEPAGIILPERAKAKIAAKRAEQSSGSITVNGDNLVISFPYNAKHVAAIKSMRDYNGRWFNTGDKTWRPPLQFGLAVLDLFPLFECSDETKAAINAAQNKPTYPGKIVMGKSNFIVTFDYDAQLVSAIKAAAPTAKFERSTELVGWKVPFKYGDKLIEAMKGFYVDPAVTAYLETQRAEQAAIIAKENVVANSLLQFIDAPLANGRQLFKHQRDGVKFLLEKRRVILADDMGLGKTFTSLVAAQAFHLPIIVICPASLQINWRREADMIGGLDLAIYSWAKIPDVPITDFVLICDESHYAQNWKSIRTKAMMKLAESSHCMGCYMLTGTPIKNGRPVNLYPLLAATRHKLSENKRMYEYEYCNAHATRFSQWDTSGASHLDKLHLETKDVMLRRLKKDCLDLPEKTRVTRGVELSAKAKAAYDEAFKKMQTEYKQRIAEGKISSESEALVMLNHLRHAGSIAKVEQTIELAHDLLEENQQVVVFVAFKESGDTIAAEFGVKLFSGDSSKEDRQAMVDRFQSGNDKVFVCTIGAGGVGITLTAAQTVILVDRPWTSGEAIQAEDRLHRIGQVNAVTSIWLQYGEIDKTIDQLLETKQERIDLVLHGKRKTMRGANQSVQSAAKEILDLIVG